MTFKDRKTGKHKKQRTAWPGAWEWKGQGVGKPLRRNYCTYDVRTGQTSHK